MFTALLDNAVTLLAALLGNMKKPKRLRRAMYNIMLFLCIMALALTAITKTIFTGEKKAHPPVRYDVPISPMSVTPEDIAGREGRIIKLEIPIPEGIESMIISISLTRGELP